MILRQISFLLLLLGIISCSFGQQVLQEKSYANSRTVDDCIAVEDGYVVLSHTKRRDPKAKPGNLTELAFLRTQSLSKLNNQMELVWEQSFPEASLPLYTELASVPGGVLAYGNTPQGGNHTHLSKFNDEGKRVWNQKYPYSGYESSFAKSMLALPDGSAYLLVNAFKYEHSTLKTALVKVDADGNKEWTHLYGKGDKAGGLHDLILTRDNQLALAGTSYPDQASWSRGNSKGWFLTMDPAQPSQTLVNHRSPNLPNFSLKGLLEDESGKYWAIGQSQGPVLVQLSAQGTPEKHIRLGDSKPFWPKKLVWNPVRKTMLVAGISGTMDTNGNDHRKVRLMEISQDWQILQDVKYQKGEFKNLEVFPSGKVLLVSTNGMQVIG